MSVIGERSAIVSLGISCQTAHQIRTHRDLLAELLGEDVRVARMPFDWMLAPLASAAAMIRNGDYFPRSMTDLDWCTHPYWPRYDCFFWHEDLAFDHPNRFLTRFQSAAAALDGLEAMERRVFIVSNTQNALIGLQAETGGLDIRLTDEGLDVLHQAIETRFGPSELYAVSYPELDDSTQADRVFHVAPDRSDWKGDDAQWAALLNEIVRDRAMPITAARTRASAERNAEDAETEYSLIG